MYFEWATHLTKTDEAEMLAILNEVARSEGTNGIPRPLSEDEAERLFASLGRALQHGECHQLLARMTRGGAVVGIATLERIKIPARSHVVEVKRMALAPESRHFAGRWLVAGWRAILDKAREMGCDIINIDVSEDGPYELWQKLGFRVYAKISDYARVGERRLDGYFLHVYVDEAYEVLERYGGAPRARGALLSQASAPSLAGEV